MYAGRTGPPHRMEDGLRADPHGRDPIMEADGTRRFKGGQRLPKGQSLGNRPAVTVLCLRGMETIVR